MPSRGEHVAAQDRLMRQLRTRSRSGPAGQRHVDVHFAQQRKEKAYSLRIAADHEAHRLSRDGAAADRRVHDPDARLRRLLRDAQDKRRRHGAVNDEDSSGIGLAEQSIRAQKHGLKLLIVHDADADGLAPVGKVRKRFGKDDIRQVRRERRHCLRPAIMDPQGSVALGILPRDLRTLHAQSDKAESKWRWRRIRLA